MFERVTGFFRRFRSKRRTSETTMLGADEAGTDDFGLDDADFGDTIGTAELGSGSLDDGGFGDLDADFGDLADSGAGLDSLSGVDTFETMADGEGAGSLAGGSGESMLDDSEAALDTFDTLGGLDSGDSGGSGGSDSDSFGDEFDDFGGGFDSLAESAAPADDLDEDMGMDMGPPVAAAPAQLKVPVVAGLGVGGLVLGAVLGFLVLPMVLGAKEPIPLDQQVMKATSNLKKAQRELAAYEALGGLAAIEQLRNDLAASQAEFATLEDLAATVEDARGREQEYDAIVAAAREAERLTAEHGAAREALSERIVEAEASLRAQRQSLAAASAEYQRHQRAMEASAVVAAAFEREDQRFTRDRTQQMLPGTAGAAAGGD